MGSDGVIIMFTKKGFATLLSLLLTVALALADNSVSAATYFSWQNIVAAIVCLLLGALFCFCGYRLFRSLVLVIGFTIGFVVCYMLLEAHTSLEYWANILISIAPGILGAILLHVFYKVAVFTAGFVLGFVLLSTVVVGFVGTYISDETWFTVTSYVLMTVTGFICGVAALFFERVLLVIATSVVGAYGCVVALDYFLYVDDAQFATLMYDVFAGDSVNFTNEWIAWTMLGVWILLSLIGAVFQYRLDRSYPASHSSE